MTFTNVDLSSAQFGGALVTDVSFTGCRLIGASLTGARGTGFRVSRSNLTMANLGGCSLRGEFIEGVRFDDADLSGCDFTEATFSDCRLRGSKLLKTVFVKADLRGADLGRDRRRQAARLRGGDDQQGPGRRHPGRPGHQRALNASAQGRPSRRREPQPPRRRGEEPLQRRHLHHTLVLRPLEPSEPPKTSSPVRTGSAGKVLTACSLAKQATGAAPPSASTGAARSAKNWWNAPVASGSTWQIVATYTEEGSAAAPTGGRGDRRKPVAGRRRRTSSESIMVALAASRCAFQTGPPVEGGQGGLAAVHVRERP